MTFEPMPVMFFNKKIKNHRIKFFRTEKEPIEKI